ncbi:MAG: hypothetical protein AAF202_05535, partial [Pseudomonadota bacterium]
MRLEIFLNQSFQVFTGSVLIHACFLASLFFIQEPKIDPSPISIEILDNDSGGKRRRLIVSETEDKPPEDRLLERLRAQNKL